MKKKLREINDRDLRYLFRHHGDPKGWPLAMKLVLALIVALFFAIVAR